MGFTSRSKIRLDPKVNLDGAGLEPATATNGEHSGFLYLNEAERFAIEPVRLSFLTGRHGELNVVKSDDSHAATVGKREPLSVSAAVLWYSIIHTPPTLLSEVWIELARVLRPNAPVLLAFQAGDNEVVRRDPPRPVAERLVA